MEKRKGWLSVVCLSALTLLAASCSQNAPAGDKGTSSERGERSLRDQHGAGYAHFLLYVNKMAETKVVTKYDDTVKSQLVQQYLEFAQGKKDVNSALRDAEQAINNKVQEEKGK
ncbi:hypothetical protein ACFFNY_32375 [Paenibacillus hodogayensis]|uniref:Peptidylprolyl isomerase n=1 Tax=Paenibacillus hodogayensis TaxID=279208 RepID=A0ABV5W6V4_9BACL